MILKGLKKELESLDFKRELWKIDEEISQRTGENLSEFIRKAKAELARFENEMRVRQAQEHQIELALCNTEDAVSVATSDGNIRLVNPAFEKLTGFAGTEIIGTSDRLLWRANDKERLKEIASVIASGQTWRGRLDLLTKEGEIKITQITATPVITPAGEITHHVCTLRDITGQIIKDREIRGQKDFLEKLINLSSNAVIVLDPKGVWKLDNLTAKTILSDMGKDARKRLSELLMREMGRKRSLRNHKLKLEMGNNENRHYFMQAERIPAAYLMPDSEKGSLCLITLSDITALEQKNSEILLRQKALISSRLERSLAQDEMAKGFVYQMKQPINVAKVMCGPMKYHAKTGNREDLEKRVEALEEQLIIMEKNLNDFKNMTEPARLSRGESKAFELIQAIDILFGERCMEKEIVLHLPTPACDFTLPLPAEVMQMIMTIMIDNAMESVEGRERQIIRISFADDRDHLTIIVEDSGRGINDNDVSKAFEPFWSTKEKGRGISLSLLHHVVNMADGLVEVKSSELGGAGFVLHFRKGVQ